MPWFRVDDTFAFHAKVIAAGNAALGLWVRAGSWSAQQVSEGFVPKAIAKTLGTAAEVRALIRVGLWEEVEGGYQFHEWLDRNPSKAKVDEDRAAAAERQRKARERAAASRRDREAVSHRDSHSDNSVSHGPPGPARPKEQTQNPPDASRRPPTTGTRLPDDFAPDDHLVAWVRENCPDVPRSEHDAFIDYWRAQPGAKGRKADWPATWRNWMRRAQDDITTGRKRPASKRTAASDAAVAAVEDLRGFAQTLSPLRAIGGS